MPPIVGRLLSISHQVSGETQTLNSVTSFPKYMSADSKTGMYCAVYQLKTLGMADATCPTKS